MAKYKKRKDGRYAAWVTTDEINPETGKESAYRYTVVVLQNWNVRKPR